MFKKHQIDIILHLASNNPNFGQNNFKKHYLENINCSKNLVNTAIKYSHKIKFISCSSSRIFKNKSGAVSEKSKISDNDYYSRFRIHLDKHLLEINNKNKNFDYTNVILFNHDSLYRDKRFLIPRIIFAIIKKRRNFSTELSEKIL